MSERAKSSHWTPKKWLIRDSLVVGVRNFMYKPMVPQVKLIPPAMHPKLRLTNQFVKAVDRNYRCIQFIPQKFPGLSIKY